jgi:hypothetical protein
MAEVKSPLNVRGWCSTDGGRAFEGQWEAGNHQGYARTGGGDTLIGPSGPVSEAPGQGVLRDDTRAHLVGNEEERVVHGGDDAAESLDERGELTGLGIQNEIGEPEGEAVDENGFPLAFESSEAGHKFLGTFERFPGVGPALAMLLDAVLHLGIQDGCRRHIDIGRGMLEEKRFGVTALSAAGASEDQMGRVWVE